MLAWFSVHVCARCMYHRALCGCERMFVYAHSIESIIHLLYMQNMYLWIVSVWDSVHKCLCMCLGHVYMHAVWVHVSRGDVFECMCPGLLCIFKYLWSVCMWAECIYVKGICKCMLYVCEKCIDIMWDVWVYGVSVDVTEHMLLSSPQILVIWWLRAQALQTSCLGLNYGFVMY